MSVVEINRLFICRSAAQQGPAIWTPYRRRMTASVHANPTARSGARRPDPAPGPEGDLQSGRASSGSGAGAHANSMVLEEVDGVLIVSPPAPITPGGLSSMTALVASVSDLLGDRRAPVVIDLSDRSVTELGVLSGALNLNRLGRLAGQVCVVSLVGDDQSIIDTSGAPIPVFRHVADAVQASVQRRA
jgi:hypothetical protein